eukprot:869930-Amphidinium_carterae.1
MTEESSRSQYTKQCEGCCDPRLPREFLKVTREVKLSAVLPMHSREGRVLLSTDVVDADASHKQ